MGRVYMWWNRMKFRRPDKIKWWNESSSSSSHFLRLDVFLFLPMRCHGAGMLHKHFDLIWGITTKLHIIIFYYLVGSGYGNGIGRLGCVWTTLNMYNVYLWREERVVRESTRAVSSCCLSNGKRVFALQIEYVMDCLRKVKSFDHFVSDTNTHAHDTYARRAMAHILLSHKSCRRIAERSVKWFPEAATIATVWANMREGPRIIIRGYWNQTRELYIRGNSNWMRRTRKAEQ